MASNTTVEINGKWKPAIPVPYYGIRKLCHCGKKFWTMDGYNAHYLYRHFYLEEN